MADTTKLFVGQIPKTMQEQDLTDMFAQYGNIVELAVIRDKFTNTSKGVLLRLYVIVYVLCWSFY